MVTTKTAGTTKAGRQRQSTAKAKLALLERIKQGHKLHEALLAAGRTRGAYEAWRKNDPEFLAAYIKAKERARSGKPTPVGDISFEEFSDKYLGQPLSWHQLQWVDVLEGRAPRQLHPSETYEAGDPNFIILNTPPEHAKSTTISINYVTYRLCMNPNVRIILVSKNSDRSKEFLYAVKARLSHPKYAALQEAFGPVEGWRADAAVWSADRIYLGSERDSGEKDPSIQAIGIGGLIYGSRADLIILDDAVVLSNAHEYEQQSRWIQQDVITRLGPTGTLLVVGTRVDAMDLYRYLRTPEMYPSGVSPWTYLAQPAVLEYGDRPDNWVTLWPKATVPWSAAVRQDDDGMFPRWDGIHLYRRRGMLNPRTWALAYMQADVEEDAVFPAQKVRAAINGTRQPGLMRRGQPNVREHGMDGLYVIGSMDPAMVGDTAVIVYAVDRFSKMRYVLDVRLRTAATPAWIRQVIKDCTDTYAITEWRIEKNGFQSFLTQDEDLRMWLANLGVRLAEHHTGTGKWDAGFGVASMATLFELGLIELPSTHMSEPVKQLVEQLIVWSAETKAKTDCVMALWFAEIRAREICRTSALEGDEGSKGFMANRFLSKRRKAQQTVVNLNDLAAAR